MNAPKKKLWFAAKTYGWGWTPATREGWLTFAIYITFIVLDFRRIAANPPTEGDTLIGFSMPFFVATFALIAICYAKGEKPRWRWGKE